MERKNMVLLTVIAVATLLVAVVGATFAFFTATVTDTRNAETGQGEAKITAGRVANKTTVTNIEGSAGKFEVGDVYPGHKEVASMQVQVTSDDESNNTISNIAIDYAITSNTLGTDTVKYYVYKSDSSSATIGTSGNVFNCQHKSKADVAGEGKTDYYEECDDVATKLSPATQVSTGYIDTSSGTKTLYTEKLTIEPSGTKTVYYYVVFELENKQEDQNTLMGNSIDGKLTVDAA